MKDHGFFLTEALICALIMCALIAACLSALAQDSHQINRTSTDSERVIDYYRWDVAQLEAGSCSLEQISQSSTFVTCRSLPTDGNSTYLAKHPPEISFLVNLP